MTHYYERRDTMRALAQAARKIAQQQTTDKDWREWHALAKSFEDEADLAQAHINLNTRRTA